MPDVVRCRVVAEDAEALRRFVRETHPDLGCHPVARPGRDGVAIEVYFRQDRLDAARAARSADRVTVTAVENVTENWRARVEEVGTGDRFATRDAVPHGLGRKE
ncbi:hypothetical protein [Streptomyces sp. UH6]|uniref:hypothetical protein n=1 Tax=Streptomyces sp. UH6 TaxID=2748379 RepID=UPI0015D5098F|nr:hypothetical protein [Streptomyces sp. UH6]NYV73701.1 hypothetical protein [Streptomyces sp. UH6]